MADILRTAPAATLAAACVGVCYLTSYARSQFHNPATREARKAISDLRAATAAADAEGIQTGLNRLSRFNDEASKLEIASRFDAVVALLSRSKGGAEGPPFAHDNKCVLAAVRFIREFATKGIYQQGQGQGQQGGGDLHAVNELVRAGGVRVLYRVLEKAMSAGGNAKSSGSASAPFVLRTSETDPLVTQLKDIASESADTLEKLTAVYDKVVLDFDVPPSAAAAAQLAEVSTLHRLVRLTEEGWTDHPALKSWCRERGFVSKVLGILRNACSIRVGALRIADKKEKDAPEALPHFLALACRDSQAYGESQWEVQERAAACVCALLRHVPECRQQLLDSASGDGKLADAFIEFVDCARIGRPPAVTDKGKLAHRSEKVTFPALQCVENLLEKCSASALKPLFRRHNDWLLVALYAIVARYKIGASASIGGRPQKTQRTCWSVRVRCRQLMRDLGRRADSELTEVLIKLRKHNGDGEESTKWGTRFPIFSETQRAEQEDARYQKESEREQQKRAAEMQMRMQMMMGGMGGGEMDEEQLEMMQQQMMAGAGGDQGWF